MKTGERVQVKMGSNEALEAALARQQAIVPLNSITIVELARANSGAVGPARRDADPPSILIFALAVLAALSAAGLVWLFSWRGWIR